MLALVCRSLRVIRALGATMVVATILGRLRLLIVAIPAAVEHQGHQTATDNDGKEDPQPEGHPTVDAHDCRRVLPGRTMGVIAVLLLGTAGLLAVETGISGTVWILLAQDSAWHAPAAVIAGLLVGTISSLLGVAGGEFIIPILIFVFGVEIERPARRVC